MGSKNTPIWTPPKGRIDQSNMARFLRFLSQKKKLDFKNYDELYHWSVNSISDFWAALWKFGGFIFSKNYSTVLDGKDIRTAYWFEEVKLNFAENLLKYKSEKTAIIYWSESGCKLKITYSELHKKVGAMVQYFKQQGVQKGDRVAAFISNRPEAIIGMLATSSIGAIWSSCSPDFGFEGVLDRFGQIRPKILIAIENYQYNGKLINCLETISKIKDSISCIKKIVLVASSEAELREGFINWSLAEKTPFENLDFIQLPFDHPLYIMYSSGTTGKPKCIVHGAGGTLIQHYKELALHTDLKEGNVITYYTTCGWMMWNWMVSSLMIGATLFIYDGSPMYPDSDILFKAIEEEKINVFGTSPKFLSTCKSKELKPREKFNLRSLKTILSTGSPLLDQNFEYVYREIKKDVQLASISGGTDILSCFMLGNPLMPVFKGELQCRGLGMKVETFNDEGKSVTNKIGELVCTAPFPSRPVEFWNDESGEKYRNAYFKEYEGVWRHGDFVKINERGGCVVYGRSDATLNAGGIRIGTAEIYEPIEAMAEIEDSIVVEVEKEDDTKVMLFVVMNLNFQFSEELKTKIKAVLRKSRSPRHVPSEIHEVSEIPRTISGKKVELAVKKILEKKMIENKEALANPEVLDQFSF